MRKGYCFLLVFILVGLLVQGKKKVMVTSAFSILTEFDKVRDLTISSYGDEAYVTIQSNTEDNSGISKLRKENSDWTLEVASFSGTFKDLEPFLSPDGLRLYFVSNRPLQDSIPKPKDFDVWYVERTEKNAPWGKPKNLLAPVNSEANEFYPALAKNGNLYFTSDREGSMGKDDIFFSEWTGKIFGPPTALDENINSPGFEYHAYISQDESYLLFGAYRSEDGLRSGDIYMSQKDEYGMWSKARPLPTSINSKQMDYCPFVDKANQQLYFTSRRDSLPVMPIPSIKKLKTYLDSYQNGTSRIYKAYFSIPNQ